jgi:hypothetical protein
MFQNDKIIYSNSYVAFLDVLGFKNMVFSQKKSDKDKLDSYFKIVHQTIGYLQGIKTKREIGYIVISDSIILTMPQGENRDEMMNNLRELCVAIGVLQSNLALNDIWMRGAISSGKTYFNRANNQIVGPAYITAYELEQNKAIFPRVILDSKIIRELNFTSSSDLINSINRGYSSIKVPIGT